MLVVCPVLPLAILTAFYSPKTAVAKCTHSFYVPTAVVLSGVLQVRRTAHASFSESNAAGNAASW